MEKSESRHTYFYMVKLFFPETLPSHRINMVGIRHRDSAVILLVTALLMVLQLIIMHLVGCMVVALPLFSWEPKL